MPKDQFGNIQRGLAIGSVGEGLADHGDLGAAAFEHLVGFEGRLVPFGVEDVAPRNGKGRLSTISVTRSMPR
jgi:hypothetical protein